YLIMLTGKAETRDVVQGMEAGADDYVGKPFVEQELRVRLRAGRRIVELQEALRFQATRDVLTGVWNRRAILESLQQETTRPARGARGDHARAESRHVQPRGRHHSWGVLRYRPADSGRGRGPLSGEAGRAGPRRTGGGPGVYLARSILSNMLDCFQPRRFELNG